MCGCEVNLFQVEESCRVSVCTPASVSCSVGALFCPHHQISIYMSRAPTAATTTPHKSYYRCISHCMGMRFRTIRFLLQQPVAMSIQTQKITALYELNLHCVAVSPCMKTKQEAPLLSVPAGAERDPRRVGRFHGQNRRGALPGIS
jgi:hypothetical protein